MMLLDVDTGLEVALPQRPRAPAARGERIPSLCTSPDGLLVAWGTETGAVRCAAVATGHEALSLRRHTSGGVLALACAIPSASSVPLLASGGADGAIFVHSLGTGQVTAALFGHGGPVLALDYAPGGGTLASGGIDSVVLWSVASSTLLRVLRGHAPGATINDVAWIGAQHLVSGGSDGRMCLWDAEEGLKKRFDA